MVQAEDKIRNKANFQQRAKQNLGCEVYIKFPAFVYRLTFSKKRTYEFSAHNSNDKVDIKYEI